MEGKICPNCNFENNWEAYECFQCKKRLGFREDQKDQEKIKVAVIVLYLISATGVLFSYLNYQTILKEPLQLELYYPVVSCICFFILAIRSKKEKYISLLFGFILYVMIVAAHFLNLLLIKFIPNVVLVGFAVLLFMGVKGASRSRSKTFKNQEDILDQLEE